MKDLAKRYPKFNENTVSMLKLIEEKLSKQPFFEITPEFVTEMGVLYLRTLSEKIANIGL